MDVEEETEERKALVDLYNLCNGPQWRRHDNWCSSRPLEEWYGVTIDNTSGRVIKLSLWQNQLTGDISKWTAIAKVTQLQILHLHFNNLAGDIFNWRDIRKCWQDFYQNRYHIIVTRKLLSKSNESSIEEKMKTSGLESSKNILLVAKLLDPNTPDDVFKNILLYLDVRP